MDRPPRQTTARSRATAIVAGAIAILAATLPAMAASRIAPPKVSCRDRVEEAVDLVIPVRGQPAHGLYSLPEAKPSGLVVFAHGYGHTSASWAHHLREASRRGLIAVAMDYRGLTIIPDPDGGLPGSQGWPAIAGAEDSIAAAQLFVRKCRPPVVTILGVSMGGNMSGLAVAIAGERGITRHDGSPLWDYWVDVEGAVNLTETYLEARLAELSGNAFARQARQDIEEETGCPIETCPEEFLRRTVPARMDDVAAAGLEGAIVIHGVDDGLVPYNQGREMATALALSGIPTEMITAGAKDSDSERETTLTGYVGSSLDSSYRSPLAGHASEKSTTHIVMETALDRLWRLMDGGAPPAYRECTSNGTGGQHPAVACTP